MNWVAIINCQGQNKALWATTKIISQDTAMGKREKCAFILYSAV